MQPTGRQPFRESRSLSRKRSRGAGFPEFRRPKLKYTMHGSGASPSNRHGGPARRIWQTVGVGTSADLPTECKYGVLPQLVVPRRPACGRSACESAGRRSSQNGEQASSRHEGHPDFYPTILERYPAISATTSSKHRAAGPKEMTPSPSRPTVAATPAARSSSSTARQ